MRARSSSLRPASGSSKPSTTLFAPSPTTSCSASETRDELSMAGFSSMAAMVSGVPGELEKSYKKQSKSPNGRSGGIALFKVCKGVKEAKLEPEPIITTLIAIEGRELGKEEIVDRDRQQMEMEGEGEGEGECGIAKS